MSTKTAKADVTPVRQRTQYTCMSTSMMMCLQALGHDLTEDEVNRVMGARPMKGASWEQALAAAQHFGCRATLTMPSTVGQLKEWTDQGIPVMIAWNPEGRDWSHASTVFDVTEEGGETWVHVADPNIPDPDETVRKITKAEFYKGWYEKWPDYLVRRPACAIDREVTVDGRQKMAASVGDPPAGTNMKALSWIDDGVTGQGWVLTDQRSGKIVGKAKQGWSPSNLWRVTHGAAFFQNGDEVEWLPRGRPWGSRVARTITDNDGRRWGPKRGLEGPLPFKGGRVLYYDPRENGGSYYDPTTDMYLDHQEAARATMTASNAGVTVKKLRDGRVVVNAGPSYQRSAKRLIEQAGYDWRLVEDQWGSWIFPKGTNVDDMLKALSGVGAELRRSAMRVANAYRDRDALAKVAEAHDCYQDYKAGGLTYEELQECLKRFEDEEESYPTRRYPTRPRSTSPKVDQTDDERKDIARALIALKTQTNPDRKEAKFLKQIVYQSQITEKQKGWRDRLLKKYGRLIKEQPRDLINGITYAGMSLLPWYFGKSNDPKHVAFVEKYWEGWQRERSGIAPGLPRKSPATSAAPAAPASATERARQVEILQVLLNKRPDRFLQSLHDQIARGRTLSEKQLKAIRQNLYRNRMRDEADHFRSAADLQVAREARAKKKKKKPKSMKDRMKIDKTKPKTRNTLMKDMAEGKLFGGGAAGRHHQRSRNVEKGRSRKVKHKKPHTGHDYSAFLTRLAAVDESMFTRAALLLQYMDEKAAAKQLMDDGVSRYDAFLAIKAGKILNSDRLKRPRGRLASVNGEEFYYLATDGNWYLEYTLYGEDEDGETNEDDAETTHYGPFSSEAAAEKFQRRNLSNTGGSMNDPSGRMKPPRRPTLRRAGYKGNPDGKDIYPNEVGHGYTEPMSGGHDIMRQLQNSLIHEQGDVVPQRPESPAITRYSFDRASLDEAARRVAATWLTQQETN